MTKYYDIDDILMEEEVVFRFFIFFLNVLPIDMQGNDSFGTSKFL